MTCWWPWAGVGPRWAWLAGLGGGLWLLARERARTGRPSTRLGVVWRFMVYGGLLAVGLQSLLALVVAVLGWFSLNSNRKPREGGPGKPPIRRVLC